jgi:hypothetical protein
MAGVLNLLISLRLSRWSLVGLAGRARTRRNAALPSALTVPPGSAMGLVQGSTSSRSVVVCPSELLVKPMRGSHERAGVNAISLT